VAEEEARAISARTKAALATAKAKGTRLGGWRGHPMSAACVGGPAASAAARSAKATRAACDLSGTIADLRDSGVTSLNGLATALNERSVPTPRGSGQWTATAVRRVLARLEMAGAD
jgi:DNA invertase Pin-like site-specific DNA recombinase